VRHFAVLENLGLAVGHGAMVCLCQETLPLTPRVDAMPAWSLA